MGGGRGEGRGAWAGSVAATSSFGMRWAVTSGHVVHLCTSGGQNRAPGPPPPDPQGPDPKPVGGEWGWLSEHPPLRMVGVGGVRPSFFFSCCVFLSLSKSTTDPA